MRRGRRLAWGRSALPRPACHQNSLRLNARHEDRSIRRKLGRCITEGHERQDLVAGVHVLVLHNILLLVAPTPRPRGRRGAEGAQWRNMPSRSSTTTTRSAATLSKRTAIALRSCFLEGCDRTTCKGLGGPKQARRSAKTCSRGKPSSRVSSQSSSASRFQGVLAFKRHGHQTEGERKELQPKT